MRGFPCKNTSCGLDSTMCLDHNQTTGEATPTNPALAVAPAPIKPSASMALRIAVWNANKGERAS